MVQAIMNFPRGFMWGTTTASHQVEGNNLNNNWYAWEIEHRLSSGLACDWWGGRWREDFDRAAENGQNAIRLSIEWSRIQPDPNRWDEDVLDYYRQMLRGLLERGLTPMVTLHCFSEPLWVSELGGWQNDVIIEHFREYAGKAVEAFHEYVSWWCTINEPNLYANSAYLSGHFPPGKKSLAAFYQVIINMIKGHSAAYQKLHEIQPQAKVGLAHQYRSFLPAKNYSVFDYVAANTISQIFNDAIPRTLTDGTLRFLGFQKRLSAAKNTQDFFGLNYFSRDNVSFNLLTPRDFFVRRFYPADDDISPTGYIANDPNGFFQALKWAKGFKLPIIVTENGTEDPDDGFRPR